MEAEGAQSTRGNRSESWEDRLGRDNLNKVELNDEEAKYSRSPSRSPSREEERERERESERDRFIRACDGQLVPTGP